MYKLVYLIIIIIVVVVVVIIIIIIISSSSSSSSNSSSSSSSITPLHLLNDHTSPDMFSFLVSILRRGLFVRR